MPFTSMGGQVGRRRRLYARPDSSGRRRCSGDWRVPVGVRQRRAGDQRRTDTAVHTNSFMPAFWHAASGRVDRKRSRQETQKEFRVRLAACRRIEGVDGVASARSQGLRAALRPAPSVASPFLVRPLVSLFAAEALHGGHGTSRHRSTRCGVVRVWTAGAREEIGHLRGVRRLILDRYVASNAAYAGATAPGADGDVVAWVRELEYGRLHLPAPDWQVPLDVPGRTRVPTGPSTGQHGAQTERKTPTSDTTCSGAPARSTGLAAADWCGRWAVAGARGRRPPWPTPLGQ
jgi:dTMP kinase